MHISRLLVLCAAAAPILSSVAADASPPAAGAAPAPPAATAAAPAATTPPAAAAGAPAGATDAAGAAGGAAKAAAPAKLQLHYESGTVTIGDQLATIALPKDYHYLQSKEARFLVEKVWGNPPDPSVLGLVVPPHQEDVFDWAIVVSYEESGYVKDDDAKSNDYAKILTDMQEGVKMSNPQRTKAGYPTIDLLGWAESPQYDAATHKVFWAKRLQFEGSKVVTLNYDVRVLGRKGVLVLSAVAEDSQLAQVASNSKEVLGSTSFTSGNRYEDFSASSGDKVAEYGIAGLITGAVLLKTGLLKLLIKPLIIGGVVVAGLLRRFFTGRQAAPAAPAAPAAAATPSAPQGSPASPADPT